MLFLLSPSTGAVLDFAEMIQFFAHLKSSSISLLTKGNLRNLQKLLQGFNEAASSVSSVLLDIIIAWCSPYYFCLIFKRFTRYCFIVIYSVINSIIIFINSIIYFNSIIISQISRGYSIIVTIY